jgi:RHS repeat-associated protein
VTTFAHDAAGRVVRATNTDADVAFLRDPLGRVLAETCNGRTVTSTYDALGRRVRRATPSGAESRWDFDDNSLPLALHTSGRTVRFAHDAAGRQVARSLDTGVTLTQEWDVSHRLLSQTVTAGGPGTARQARLLQHRTYGYSPDGYVTDIDDMLVGLRRFDLDPARRVTAVRGTGWEERYAYDAAGNVTDASWPVPAAASALAVAPTQQADGLDRVDGAARGGREYAGTLIRRAGNVRYEHDAQGRVTLRQQKRLSAKPRTWRYTWDADDRMTGITTPDGQRWRYRYDPFGRRIAKQRLGDDGGIAEQVNFTWDGVVLAEQVHSLGNRLDGIAASMRVTTWEWDSASFRPLTQTEHRPSARTVFHHSNETGPSRGIVGDPSYPGSNSRLGYPGYPGYPGRASDDYAGRNTTEGPDNAGQEWFDARFYAIVTDLVGTPTELVDPGGDFGWHARTTLWGASPPPADGDVDCPLRFPGQYHDGEAGLNYNYHRHYDPATGRYTSADPLGLAPSPNPHTYVHNPLAWLDPLGLSPYRPLWTSTRRQSSAQNAYRHFIDHGADFPDAQNAVQYVEHAQDFLHNPPPGTLTKTRPNGDVIRYDPSTNTFGVMDTNGAPRTMFKPDPAAHGQPTNLDYFNAQ